jgi:hypothetical protein
LLTFAKLTGRKRRQGLAQRAIALPWEVSKGSTAIPIGDRRPERSPCRQRQFANEPANISGLHRIAGDNDFLNMIASGAVERAKFESRRPWCDARKPHTGLAFRAAESLYCEQRNCGWVIGHCIASPETGAAMEPACSPDSQVAGQYWPVSENKSKATNTPFRGRRPAILWRSHGQNRADSFGLVVDDGSGGRQAQRGRGGPARAHLR